MRTFRTFRTELINPIRLVLSIVALTAVLTQTAMSGIIVTTEARDAAGNILVVDTNSGATSASAGFSIFDPITANSYAGFAAGHTATANGFNTLKFQLQTDATVQGMGHIETQSRITWNDTISNGIAGSSANLHFTIDGDIRIIEPFVNQSETWTFAASGVDQSNSNIATASIIANDLNSNSIPSFANSGWTQFDTFLTDGSLNQNQFRGVFVVPVTIGSAFAIDFDALAFVDGGDGQVIGDLMNSAVLTAVTDSGGMSLTNVSFDSGLGFSAVSSVPEPASGLVLLLSTIVFAARRSRKSIESC